MALFRAVNVGVGQLLPVHQPSRSMYTVFSGIQDKTPTLIQLMPLVEKKIKVLKHLV